MAVLDVPVRITVVVPAFNEERYLAQTLTSLQAQEYARPYEIIVVDNNSTDATVEIAERHGVTVLHEPRSGVCSARQCGTAAARGEIVVSTDADTIHPPDWLARVDAEFTRGSDVTLVAGPCQYLNPTWWAVLYPKLLFGAVGKIYARTGRLVYITATNTAFVRAAFSGYDTSLTQGGDEFDLLRRLRGHGRTVWLPDNAVNTSPRRLRQGLLYTLFVSLLTHYLLAYLLNRLTSRTVLGTAPVFRPDPDGERDHRLPGWRLVASVVVVTAATALVVRAASG
jgi:glycosyltransferase involved in cell wall biosynthesis